MTEEAPSWFLEAIGTKPETGSVRVDGATIVYRAWGWPGCRAVVLVHGGSAHAGWWDHIAPQLADGRQVVAIDLSGHGDSDRRDTYDIDTWAREVLAVAAAVGQDTAVRTGATVSVDAATLLVGHSMGGAVSLRAAALDPSQVFGVIAVDSVMRELSADERAARERRALGPPRRYTTREIAIGHFKPMPEQREPMLPYVLSHVAAASVRECDGAWTWKFDPRIMLRRPLTPPEVPRLECRIALLRAQYSRFSAKTADDLNERLGRRVPSIELPQAGHHILFDQPLVLVAALRTLMTSWEDVATLTGPRV